MCEWTLYEYVKKLSSMNIKVSYATVKKNLHDMLSVLSDEELEYLASQKPKSKGDYLPSLAYQVLVKRKINKLIKRLG